MNPSACKETGHGTYQSTQCTVCMEDVDRPAACTLTCNHTFHLECISTWVRSQTADADVGSTGPHASGATCPLCRRPIELNGADQSRSGISASFGPANHQPYLSGDGAPFIGGGFGHGPPMVEFAVDTRADIQSRHSELLGNVSTEIIDTLRQRWSSEPVTPAFGSGGTPEDMGMYFTAAPSAMQEYLWDMEDLMMR